ncbi:hypothetical protein H8356DRAFT_1691023 [Neocallimastix lanati (nom. inval.)]|nr:hypothetical protein H8356DRAFT_1691023 [Neocallimastix sp. JGI-2020a]
MFYFNFFFFFYIIIVSLLLYFILGEWVVKVYIYIYFPFSLFHFPPFFSFLKNNQKFF